MKELNLLEIFAKNLRIERNKQGLSQEKLAELSNLHRTYIGMIERAEKNLTLLSAEKIARALNISVIELLKK